MDTSLNKIGVTGKIQDALSASDLHSLSIKFGLFLSRINHPDRGGDQETYKALQEVISGLIETPRDQENGSNAYLEIEALSNEAERIRNLRIETTRACLDYIKAISSPSLNVVMFCGPCKMELVDAFSAMNHTTGGQVDMTLYDSVGNEGKSRIADRHKLIMEVDKGQNITITKGSEKSLHPFKRLVGVLRNKRIDKALSDAGLSRDSHLGEGNKNFFETRKIPHTKFLYLIPFMTPFLTSPMERNGYLVSLNLNSKGTEPPYYTLEGLIRKIERV